MKHAILRSASIVISANKSMNDREWTHSVSKMSWNSKDLERDW